MKVGWQNLLKLELVDRFSTGFVIISKGVFSGFVSTQPCHHGKMCQLVPQGSVLGPLRFLIYTSDLPEQIESPVTCNLFADDTALCSIAESVSISVEALQLATTNSGNWLKDWRLSVNLAKTSVMATRTVASVPVLLIYPYGESLQSASSQRHLGVMLSADLRWSCQNDFVLSQAAMLLHGRNRCAKTCAQAPAHQGT